MSAYYNEIDPYAAQWLRNLIDKGLIAPGVVDERNIEDVKPDELMGYTQCHFFAGIGVWSLALRRAGWPDNRPIWTGSCPCQPFSAAGTQAGFDDERHLWPHFQWLIKQRKPSVVIGEQVASKNAAAWIDLVQADMEALGYAFGAVALPSAGVGAPHIRDRAYWVGHTDESGPQELAGDGGAAGREGSVGSTATAGVSGGLGHSDSSRRQLQPIRTGSNGARVEPSGGEPVNPIKASRDLYNEGIGPGPTNGFWGDADWLLCRDDKWRPVESGTFPLADRVAARVGRLRANWDTPAGKEGFGHRTGRLKGYGNAINAAAAEAFIGCVMEVINAN